MLAPRERSVTRSVTKAAEEATESVEGARDVAENAQDAVSGGADSAIDRATGAGAGALEDALDDVPGSEAVSSATDTAGEALSGGAGGLVDAAAGAGVGALDDAVHDIPGGGAISGATEVAGGALSSLASGGSGGDVLSSAIGSATDVGAGALGDALDELDVPGGEIIGGAVGQAAQLGQSAIGQALRNRGEDSGVPPLVSDEGETTQETERVEGAIEEAVGGGGGQTERARVFFETDGDVTWDVAQLTIEEAFNTPYEVALELRTEQLEAEPSQLLGADATVLIERGENQQRWPGLIVDVLEGEGTGDYLSVTIKLVPALWLLRQRRDTRIFQDLSAPDILGEILTAALGDYQREVRLELDGEAYPTREYCTQYDESDLDFALRLMEEEGIVASFDGTGEAEVLVLSDSQQYEDTSSGEDGALQLSEYQGTVGGHEYISHFRVRSKMLPTKLSLRHYDWTRTPRTSSPADAVEDPAPLMGEAEGEAEEGAPPNGAALGPVREEYDHEEHPVTITDYGDGEAYGADDVERQTTLRRELQARDARVGSGTSTASGLRPGLVFEMSGHRQADLDGAYLVTAVRHTFMAEGTESDEQYVNEFRCLPQGVPFRPDRKRPRRRIRSLLTATVVGPSGDEIHTDEHGRVKVRFHWDRRGDLDGEWSCYLRVMQPWAGAGWGFVFLPRVGMEVAVSFVGGDPDQPVVMGSFYNAANRPPLALDTAEKTRSTIKTRSTPQAEGYNELTFEDAAGEEQIIVHAQKDYNETVENNHSTSVSGNQTNSVSGNQSESVGGDQSLSVTGTRSKTVTGDETNTLEAARTTDVTGAETVTLHDVRSTTITGTDTIEVGGQVTETLGGGRETSITGDDVRTVGGGDAITNAHHRFQVNATGQLKLVQGESHFLRLDNLIRMGTDASYQVFNSGTMVEGDDGGTLTHSADTEIKLECGAGSISIKSDGTIELTGTTVKINAGGAVEVGGSGVKANGGQLDLTGGVINVAGGVVRIN